MATEVKLPRLGQGMESGTIVKWLKSEGEPVQKGEALYELDTEKVTQEVEAEASGVLLKIAVQEGEVEVGRTVAIIGEEGEQVSVESADGDGGPPGRRGGRRGAGRGGLARPRARGTRARTRGVRAGGGGARRARAEPGRRPDRASPLARRIARERGRPQRHRRHRALRGRIVAEDVERAGAPSADPSAAGAPEGEPEVVTLSSTRRTIARRLTEAWQAPVFQLGTTVETSVLALREELVGRMREGEAKPTVNDVLTRITAAAPSSSATRR